MKRLMLTLFAILPSTIALADELSLDDVVARARVVADRKPQHTTCNMSLEVKLYDKDGALEHRELREGDARFDGERVDLSTRRAWRDGKALSDETLKAERDKRDKAERDKNAKKKTGDDFELAPLAARNAAGERFELVRHEALWGHDAYVLKVTALHPGEQLATGTLWIDAASFVELKGELVPARLPDHADWVQVQEQFALVAGVPLPTFLHVIGAGHFLMFKKTFETTMKWDGCK